MPRMIHETGLKQALSPLRKQSAEGASAATAAKVIAGFRAARRASMCLGLELQLRVSAISFGLARASTRFVAPGRVRYSNPTANFVELPYAQSGVRLEGALIVRMEVQPSESLRLTSRAAENQREDQR